MSGKWIGGLALGSLLNLNTISAEPGRTALNILNRSFDARAQSMGESLSADYGRLDSMSFNPAGMAKLGQFQTSATFQRGLIDDSIGYLNLGVPFSFGSFYASASYLDGGDIDLNLTNGTNETRKAQEDLVGSLGVAIGRASPLSLGLTAKFFKSELAEVETATGWAGDAGLLWQTPLSFLSLGGAIQNVGDDITYDSDDDSLPTISRYGVRLLSDQQTNPKWTDFLKNRYLLTLEGVHLKEEDATINMGFEIIRDFGPDNTPYQAALRGGYVESRKSPTVGVGVRIHSLIFDYAMNFVDDIDLAHRVTMTLLIGSETRAEEKKPNTLSY